MFKKGTVSSYKLIKTQYGILKGGQKWKVIM